MDAHDLLLSFAHSPAYVETVAHRTSDVVRGLHEISCPVLVVQGLTDALISTQPPRYLAFAPKARLQLLPNLSHVPISDNPRLIAGLIVDFTAAETFVGLSYHGTGMLRSRCSRAGAAISSRPGHCACQSISPFSSRRSPGDSDPLAQGR